MCGSPKSNNGAVVEQQNREAEDARRREEERAERVGRSVSGVRDAFARYDQSYFDNLRGKFIEANRDTLQQQQNNEAEQALYGMTRAGLANSSAGNRQRAELAQGFARQNNTLEQGASDFAENQKGDLFSAQQTQEAQARATGDAEGASIAATSAAGNIARTPEPTAGSWLAPALSSAIGGVGAYNSGQEAGFYRASAARLFNPGGSGRTQR